MPPAAIIADYAATGERVELILDRLRSSATYKADIDGKPALVHEARPQTMTAFLAEVDARHGGVTAWLAGHDFSGEDLRLLRARLREP